MAHLSPYMISTVGEKLDCSCDDLAGIWERIVAHSLDSVLVSVPLVAMLVGGSTLGSKSLLGMGAIWFIGVLIIRMVLLTQSGQTVGKKVAGVHVHAGIQQVVRVGLGLLAVVGDDVEAAREQYGFLGSVQGRMTSSPITESLRVNGGQR